MRIIFTFIKIVTMLGICVHLSFIHLLFQLRREIFEKNETNETIKEKSYCSVSDDYFSDYSLLCYALVVASMLFVYMFTLLHTFEYHQFDWEEYSLFQLVENYYIQRDSNKIHIQSIIYMIKISFAFIGYVSGKNMLHYLTMNEDNNNCEIIYVFMGFGFIPYLFMSITSYYNCVVGIILLIATIFAPRTMFYYFDRVLENRKKNHQVNKNENKKDIKIFIGSLPECCVCYEEDCSINACGHLICNTCVSQLKNVRCPLCMSSINIIQSYKNYKKNINT
jgi:hypothetical protein